MMPLTQAPLMRRPAVGFIATPPPAASGFPWWGWLIAAAALYLVWRMVSPKARARRAAIADAKTRYMRSRARIAERFA